MIIAHMLNMQYKMQNVHCFTCTSLGSYLPVGGRLEHSRFISISILSQLILVRVFRISRSAVIDIKREFATSRSRSWFGNTLVFSLQTIRSCLIYRFFVIVFTYEISITP